MRVRLLTTAAALLLGATLAVGAVPAVRWTIFPPAEDRLIPELPFTKVRVDWTDPLHVWGKGIGDIDGDGDVDLIAGGWEAGGLAWYENPSWRRRQIAEGQEYSTDIETCDVDRDGDGDGDLDLFGGNWNGAGVHLYRNELSSRARAGRASPPHPQGPAPRTG